MSDTVGCVCYVMDTVGQLHQLSYNQQVLPYSAAQVPGHLPAVYVTPLALERSTELSSKNFLYMVARAFLCHLVSSSNSNFSCTST